MSERDLIDLIGNVDVSMLADKIIEHDMNNSKKFLKSKEGKIILFLFPAILLVFIVVFVCLVKKRKH